MVKTVMYTVVITTISILLIGMMAFDAEAKTFSHDHMDILVGDSFSVRDRTTAIVTIQPINDDPQFLKLSYTVSGLDGAFGKGSACIVKNNILKISAMKKATVTFDTNDIDDKCKHRLNTHDGVVSLSFQTNSEIIHEDLDDTTCVPKGEGVEECIQTKGTRDTVNGIVSGTAFGKSLKEDTSGIIGQINTLDKMWTTP